MTLLAVAPAVAFLALVALCLARSGDWRSAVLEASVIWGTVLVLLTEVLSLPSLLTTPGLAITWLALDLVLVAAVLRSGEWRRALSGARRPAPPESRALAAVAVLIALVGVPAVLAASNNWDALAYHLPRVAEWAQQRSVRHFPAQYPPQLHLPPFAEYVILHLQVLTRGDRFANIPQWLALIGCTIAVSALAEQLGAGSRGQVFSVAFAATLPMVILQGSTAQNDLVVSFWLLTFCHFLLRIRKATELQARNLLPTSAALGLALLTKGTAYVFALPFCLWIAVDWLRRFRWRGLAAGVVAGAIVLALNLGHYARNLAVFGAPLVDQEHLSNEDHSPLALGSVAVRNLSLHLSTPFSAVNARLERAIRFAHRAVGHDADDRRTTAWGNFGIHKLNTWEDQSGNPLHLVLAFVAVALLWRRGLVGGDLRSYLLGVAGGLALFCVIFKYQAYNSRLHTPLFLMIAPLVGRSMESLRSPKVANVVAVLLLIASLPWVLFNRQRPLLPIPSASASYPSFFTVDRFTQYLMHPIARHLRDPYLGSAEFLSGQEGDVGLLLPPDAFEYPLWVLLGSPEGGRRLGNVAVDNPSKATVPPGAFHPRFLVRVREQYMNLQPGAALRVEGATLDADRSTGLDQMQLGRARYVRRWSQGPVDVLEETRSP